MIREGGLVSLETVPDPILPGPDGVIVTVEKSAICGSDLHILHGAMGGEAIRPGHEVIGTIAELGPEVRNFRLGDRVLVSGVIGCGWCGPCRNGDPVACSANATTAIGTIPDCPGGQAEALAVPVADAFCLKIPDAVDDDTALLLTDILPTAYLGASMAAISPGGSVAVIGAGPVGLLAIECAKLYSPDRIFCVDLLDERLSRAEARGAIPISNADGLAVARILEATGGQGAASVIECIGLDQTVSDAVMATGPSGTTSVIGVNLSMAAPFPMGMVFLKRITLRAAIAAIPSTWSHLVPLIEKGQKFGEGLFTHRLGLSEVTEAYDLFNTRRDGVEKVVLDPSR